MPRERPSSEVPLIGEARREIQGYTPEALSVVRGYRNVAVLPVLMLFASNPGITFRTHDIYHIVNGMQLANLRDVLPEVMPDSFSPPRSQAGLKPEALPVEFGWEIFKSTPRDYLTALV